MEPHHSSPDALDALRIQAAAVAAQQAALTEEELRLQQRRGALEKQEAQLAAHLDDRRRRLLELRDEIKAERAALKRQRAELLDGLHQEKENVVRQRQQVEELRERQKQRWREHWRQHEATLKQREQELNAEQEQLRQKAESLERERTVFEQGRLKLNAELELRRCALQEEEQELALAQQRWHETINLEQAERQRLEKALAAREAATAATERAFTEQIRQWEQSQEARRQELDGLEKRIRHLRSQLPRTQLIAAPVPVAPRVVAAAEVPPALRRLAEEVVDQRWRLLEQWRRLLEIHDLWNKEKADIADALQVSALHFIEREQQVAVQEQDLAVRVAAVSRQQEALTQQRQRLEGWHAQLTARESGWESERAVLQTEMQAREERVVTLTRQLGLVRQRRERRRRQEIEELRTLRTRCEEMRREYVALWQENQKRQTALMRRERELAAQRLALERYRAECLARSSNPAAAEKRIERLTQQLTTRVVAGQRDIEKQRAGLAAEAARLDGHAEQLTQWQNQLDQREQDLAQREADNETRQLEQTAMEQQRVRELRQLQLRHECDERQLAALREEVERVARLLLDEAPEEMTQAA